MKNRTKLICIVITIISIFVVFFGIETYQQYMKEQSNSFQDAVISSDLSDEEIMEMISESGEATTP